MVGTKRVQVGRKMEIDPTITPEQRELLKRALAQSLKGGAILDVLTPKQAKIAEDAGARAVMAHTDDAAMIESMMKAVSIPVMAKCHNKAEAQTLEALGVDYLYESDMLTAADEGNPLDKHKFNVPFVCSYRNLGEALRRISEGAAMLRTENVQQINILSGMNEDELLIYATEIHASYALVQETAKLGRLPVVNFASVAVATSEDVALIMQPGVDGVFVDNGIFQSDDPARHAAAIVKATIHHVHS